MSTKAGVQTFKGSCHCGAVRFEADFDPSQGTGRCNCTVCTKLGYWGANVRPDAFRLLSGEENLADYTRSPSAHGRFCKTCGVRAFGHGNVPEIGGEYVSVNLNCLDGADLTGVQVTYRDGRANTWALLKTETYVSPFAVSSAPSPASKSASA